MSFPTAKIEAPSGLGGTFEGALKSRRRPVFGGREIDGTFGQLRRVTALAAGAAALVENPTGSITVFRKNNRPAYGPLGDSLDDLRVNRPSRARGCLALLSFARICGKLKTSSEQVKH